MLMRRQFVLTLILMPIAFGIWYAAGALFSAPAVWLCDMLIQAAYPHLIESVWLQDMKMGALTQFGMLGGEVVAASAAGNQIELEINTRLVSYSIAFYAALLMASSLQNGFYKFCWDVLPVGGHGVWPGIDCRQGPFGDGGGAFYPRRVCRRQTAGAHLSI